MGGRLIDAAEAGKLLGFSPRHVRRCAALGALPAAGKIGGWAFDRDVIVALAANGWKPPGGTFSEG